MSVEFTRTDGRIIIFNPGFLGAAFLWWVGQIADDSTWRDNISKGNYEDKNDVPGWGRRYKVRIIGLHDQGEEQIPSEQLPWANIMYPVTAGGFQANRGQSPNLQQGNMVFGFFLDGQDHKFLSSWEFLVITLRLCLVRRLETTLLLMHNQVT